MTEHEKAKAWRKRRKLSVNQLAELTGYGHRSIYWMERGQTPPNAAHAKSTKIAEWVWQRYKIACAGVEAQLRSGKRFDW